MTGPRPRPEGGEARVRYGELMRDAGTAVWSATTSLATTRFPDAQAAADTITAWRDLLETSRRHGWVLLGSGTRVQGLRTSPGTTAVDRAAVALVDRLADLTRPRGRAEPTASREPAVQGTLRVTNLTAECTHDRSERPATTGSRLALGRCGGRGWGPVQVAGLPVVVGAGPVPPAPGAPGVGRSGAQVAKAADAEGSVEGIAAPGDAVTPWSFRQAR